MSFERFEQDDHEPAAVVRTLADLSLMLVLMFSMLVGQRSTPATPPLADPNPARKQAGGRSVDVTIALVAEGKFRLLPNGGESLSAAALASKLRATEAKSMSVIALQFSPNTLASQLHAALLELQAAFANSKLTNTTIKTVPET